ncbi:MAG: hypothetical protein JRG90_08925 [Deltaproteobacteria bacterium]|nr:hypothetical protein [Deltaproteobacteria bacterium]
MAVDTGEASFGYGDCALPVRSDIPAAHRRAWSRLSSPGTWWSGEQRVAIAGEVRAANGCAFCSERRAASSPSALDGVHDSTLQSRCLPDAAVDAVHRITTDAGRLTQSFVGGLSEQGVYDAAYVELVGVVVTVLSIDRFHRGIGVAPEPLPEPEPGEPSRYRPSGAKASAAFVPMISGRDATGAEADLYHGLPTAPNVLAALSLVPDELRQLHDLSAAHYLPMQQMMRFDTRLRAISRAQIELLAGRVSALNECFY